MNKMSLELTSLTAIARIRLNENIASVTFGWCCAMIVVCTTRIISSWSHGRKQTKRYCYFLLCAFLLFDSAILAVLAWTNLIQSQAQDVLIIAMSLLLWSIQIHLYLQLVINRICILDIRNPSPRILRGGVAAITILANLAMLCFWLLPQTNGRAYVFTEWCPCIEKIIYVVIDIALNGMFILQVRNRLMRAGLHKYKKLITFNIAIFGVSMLLDALLLGMQWFSGSRYMFVMIHPLVFINKLMLEMSICEYMAKISRETNVMKLLSSFAASPRYQEFDESLKSTIILEKQRPPSVYSLGSLASPQYEAFEKDEALILVRATVEEKQLPQLPIMGPISPLTQAHYSHEPVRRSNLSYYKLSI